MISRRAVIVGLIVCDLAVVNMMVMAVRAGHGWTRAAEARPASGNALVEGGPSRTFDVGAQPRLNVDIGNADLTIRAGAPGRFDVSLSKSSDFGMFRETAPILASRDGDVLSIDVPAGWSRGDDRMVTIEVPPDARVDVAAAGDITADGLRGESSFKSSNGNVTIDDYRGPALRVASDDGAIDLLGVAAATLHVKSDDGHVEASALQARDGTIASNDGHVALEFADGTDSVVDAHASDGNVRVSGFAGAPATNGGDDDDNGRASASIRIGQGDGRLFVTAGDGDIKLSHG